MPTELTGEALLDYYREAVRAWVGNRAGSFVGDFVVAVHKRGWYYIGRAYRLARGGFYYHEHQRAYHAAQVREMADELLKRAEEAQDAQL